MDFVKAHGIENCIVAAIEDLDDIPQDLWIKKLPHLTLIDANRVVRHNYSAQLPVDLDAMLSVNKESFKEGPVQVETSRGGYGPNTPLPLSSSSETGPNSTQLK